MRIGLISDNHGYEGDEVYQHLKDCDEIWHAGDIGLLSSIKKFEEMATFRAVYGNVDDKDIRASFPLDLTWECEGVKVYMTHIGGYPGRYRSRALGVIQSYKPDLFISGHSHILKVMPDRKLNLLHMNPGAYGHHGFHKFRTLLKFEVISGKIKNLSAVELGLRGIINN